MKFLIQINVEEIIESTDPSEAVQDFLIQIENEPQQTISTWLEEQIVVKSLDEREKK